MLHITEVIKKPVLTEKSITLMDEENKYTFDVDPTATKTQIREAVEKMFDVKVVSVHTMNCKRKTKRLGKFVGLTQKRKKAIVKLAEGSKIELFGEE